MSMGGGKGGGGTSTPESQQLAGMGSRFEQESRGSRSRGLDTLSGIMNYGADYRYPAETGPATYSKADIADVYNRYDIGKGQDINRILGDMPGDRFTIDQLRSGADKGGLSGRSKLAWEQATGELAQRGQRPGPGGPEGGMLPLVQTAMDRSRLAIGKTAGQVGDQARMMGVYEGNPFLQRNLAQAGTLAQQQTQQIAPRITDQFLTNVMPLAFNQSGAAQGALSNAAKTNAQMIGANQAAGAAGGAQTMQAVGQIASIIAMAAIMT